MPELQTLGVDVECIWWDVDVLQLRVRAWNGSFGGTTLAYVGHDHLENAARLLTGFPANGQSSSVELLFGTMEPAYAGGGATLRFFCVSRLLHPYVEVTIRERGDRYSNKPKLRDQTVALTMRTEANAIDRFARALASLKTGEDRPAVLDAYEESL